MNILQYFFNSVLFILILSTFSCTTPESERQQPDWRTIIKELEVILVSDTADSVKAFQINSLFESHHISLEDYRDFYEKSIQEKPLKNLELLKDIEQLIGEDMKQEAQRQRKNFDQVDYRSRQTEEDKDIK